MKKILVVGMMALAISGTAWAQGAEENTQVRDWRYLLTIHEIAQADDDARLQKLVGDNPDRTRTRMPDGRTPVHIAAEFGALKSLRVLGKAGADFNVVDDKKRTPLTIAVGLNYATTVKTLLDLGADVNQEGSVAGDVLRTPVSLAARQGSSDVMKILLDAKADVSKMDADGTSPLTSAAASKQWETMKMLLEHAANSNVKDRAGNTALLYAVTAGNIEAAKAVIAHSGDPNVADASKMTPLLIATLARDDKMIALLLENKADPNLADAQGRTPMSASESPAVWKMLAAAGANVNVMVGEATRLEHYIAAGDAERLKGWLEFKPDPLAPDKLGRTAKELARAGAERPTGTYEGDAARKEIAAMMEEYQNKAWEARETARKGK